jgi:RNA polymerase sigma factor (sigma-70 family)
MDPSLEELVRRAQDGNAPALERVVREIGDNVYGLAVRMLWHPEDAEDATQEILMKVVTHLSTFRGESAFPTWVYRIATNHLLSVRQSRVETAIRSGRVDPARLLFAGHPERAARALPVLEQVSEMEELHSIAGIFQSHPDYSAPERVIAGVHRLLDSGTFSLLS